jgi:hypothetical protein
MLIIDRSVITDGGAALLNSGDPINITSVKTGSGTYTSSEDIKSRTALKSTQYSYTPSSVSVDGATRSIDALLSNYDPVTEQAIVTSDYTLTEVGLFATVNGADVLFAIGVSYDGSEVPAFTGQNKSEIIVNWDMAVSGTDAITITATGAPALAADLNNHVGSEVLSADGVHGIRSILDGENYNLQVKVNDEWVNASGSKYTASITPASDDVTISGFSGDAETVTLTVVGDGIVTATSGDDSIATVSLNGSTLTITSVAAGSTTITLSMPETAQYTAATATINVVCNVIAIGNTYFFGGFYWTAAEDLGNNAVCLQSQGMTAGTWPGYKLTSDYSGTKNYGSANTAYNGNIDGDNIANYDEVTQTWYSKYSAVEKTGQAYGSGLFLVSNAKCGATTSGTQGSGNYWNGLKIAPTRFNVGTASWTGTVINNNAWIVTTAGYLNNEYSQNYTGYGGFVIAPAFNLDLTKVKLDGSTIMLLSESKPAMVSFASATPSQREAVVRAYEAGIIDITEYWSDGEEATATLPAIASSGTGWSVGESQPQQEVTIVLSLDNCKELVNVEDNGQKRTKFLYHQKDALNTPGYMNTTNTNTGSWEGCARRGWCNNGYKAAMIQAFGDIFHELKNITAQTYNGTTNQTSNDYFALPAGAEVFKGDATYGQGGTAGAQTAYSNLTEFNALTRFTYYETTANRVNKIGSSGSADFWWERSPRYQYATGFCVVNSDGNATGNGASVTYGLAPFGGV